jgi:hypothetical protein
MFHLVRETGRNECHRGGIVESVNDVTLDQIAREHLGMRGTELTWLDRTEVPKRGLRGSGV